MLVFAAMVTEIVQILHRLGWWGLRITHLCLVENIFFLILNQNVCCRYSKESSHAQKAVFRAPITYVSLVDVFENDNNSTLKNSLNIFEPRL